MLLKGSLVDPNPYVKRFQMKNAPLATMHTTAFAAQRAAAGASHTTEAPIYSCLRTSAVTVKKLRKMQYGYLCPQG